jgi:hypothetical protein
LRRVALEVAVRERRRGGGDVLLLQVGEDVVWATGSDLIRGDFEVERFITAAIAALAPTLEIGPSSRVPLA